MKVGLVLVALALVGQPAPEAEIEAPPVVVVEPNPAEIASPAVSEAILRAAEDECVVLTIAPDDDTRVGRLESVTDHAVVLGRSTGDLVEVDRSAIAALKIAAGGERAGCRAVVPPQLVVAPTGCVDDDGCEEPRTCSAAGRCEIEPWYVDELYAEGQSRKKGGRIALIVGGAMGAIGLVMLPTGLVVERDAYRVIDSCPYDGTSDSPRCNNAWRRREQGYATWAVGAAFLASGVATTILGVVLHSLGKSKLRRADAYRKHVQVSASPTSFGVSGRF